MEPRSQMRGRPLSPPPFWFVCPVFCMGSSVRKYTRAKKIHSNIYGGLERCCLLARKDTRLLSPLPEESGPYHTLFGTCPAGSVALFALEHETRTRPRCHVPNKAFVAHCLDGVLCHSFLAPAVQLPRLPFEYPPHSRPLPALPYMPRTATATPTPKQTMPSKANIYGHPIHPMLVAFPIVCFILAFIGDIIYEAGWAGGDYSQFAYILLIAGIATAIAAAITGLIEYSVITYVLSLNICCGVGSSLELFYCV